MIYSGTDNALSFNHDAVQNVGPGLARWATMIPLQWWKVSDETKQEWWKFSIKKDTLNSQSMLKMFKAQVFFVV